jgi:hypothetical protein
MSRHPRSVLGLVLAVLIVMPVNAFGDRSPHPPTSVLCERLPAPTTGACTVTPGNSALVLKGDRVTGCERRLLRTVFVRDTRGRAHMHAVETR